MPFWCEEIGIDTRFGLADAIFALVDFRDGATVDLEGVAVSVFCFDGQSPKADEVRRITTLQPRIVGVVHIGASDIGVLGRCRLDAEELIACRNPNMGAHDGLTQRQNTA